MPAPVSTSDLRDAAPRKAASLRLIVFGNSVHHAYIAIRIKHPQMGVSNLTERLTMRRFISAFAVASILLAGTADGSRLCRPTSASTSRPPRTPRRSTRSSTTSRLAVKTKDSKLLLVADAELEHPVRCALQRPEDITMVRATYDVNFDGLRAGGYADFARFISDRKGADRGELLQREDHPGRPCRVGDVRLRVRQGRQGRRTTASRPGR